MDKMTKRIFQFIRWFIQNNLYPLILLLLVVLLYSKLFFIGKIPFPGDLVNFKFNEAGYQRVFQDKSTVILENPKAMERVYLAPNIIQVPLNEVYTLMNNHQLDPHITVALTDNLNIQKVSGEGEVKILSYSPNQVDISTNSKKEEVLVLADQYDEGWKAKVDGRETKISRANMIFRAIKIPSGIHQIMFYYWPTSFEVGMKIFLASLAIIVVMFGVSYFKKIL